MRSKLHIFSHFHTYLPLQTRMCERLISVASSFKTASLLVAATSPLVFRGGICKRTGKDIKRPQPQVTKYYGPFAIHMDIWMAIVRAGKFTGSEAAFLSLRRIEWCRIWPQKTNFKFDPMLMSGQVKVGQNTYKSISLGPGGNYIMSI